uniref:Kynurenine formamidase n=1 Tax=Rhipicephalus appendiculatus TaxID=34631 RepID=A0A131YUH4_RHIAP
MAGTVLRTMVLAGLMGAVTFGQQPCAPPSTSWAGRRVVDLSFSYNDRTVYWDEDGRFRINATVQSNDVEDWVLLDEFSTPTHGGTHMDAPRHFSKIGWSASEIPLDRLLMVPIALIDVQAEAARNASYLMPLAEVLRWEAQNGPLPNNCLLLIRSGWSKYYNNRNAFYGTDQYGLRHFPAIEPATVEFLTRQRNLAGVGIETASVDFYGVTRSHHLLAAANVYILENLADLSLVPPVGAHAIVMPMKIDGAGGAPTRVAALLP